MLDPCCGSGSSALRFANELGCKSLYVVELRDINIAGEFTRLAPCDIKTTRITRESFGLVFMRPPSEWKRFDLPSESEYLMRCTGWLKPGGVVVAIVLPGTVRYSYTPFVMHLQSHYRDISGFRYGDGTWDPLVVIARKRYTPLENPPTAFKLVAPKEPYPIPASTGPKMFMKGGPTIHELMDAVGKSPLQRIFLPRQPEEKQRPPLELGKGHISLLVASGQVNGLVKAAGHEPHVVRGMTRKEGYIVSQTSDGNDGKTTITSEKVTPLIRAAWPDGRIETYE